MNGADDSAPGSRPCRNGARGKTADLRSHLGKKARGAALPGRLACPRDGRPELGNPVLTLDLTIVMLSERQRGNDPADNR